MIFPEAVHVHIPRTGGSSIRNFVQHLVAGGHLPAPEGEFSERSARAVKNLAPGKRTFTWVRNPWAWYVSRYKWIVYKTFELGDRNPEGQMTRGSDVGIFDVEVREHAMTFRDHMLLGFDRDKDRGAAITYMSGQRDMRPWSDCEGWPDDPYFSYRACIRDMLYAKDSTDFIVDRIERTEQLDETAEDVLRWAGLDWPSHIRFADVANARVVTGPDYREWYDDRLAARVAEVDAEIIETFGYEFDAVAA